MMTVGSHVVAMIMVGVGGGDYDDDDGGGCGGDDDDDDDDDDDVDLCWEKKIPLPPLPPPFRNSHPSNSMLLNNK